MQKIAINHYLALVFGPKLRNIKQTLSTGLCKASVISGHTTIFERLSAALLDKLE